MALNSDFGLTFEKSLKTSFEIFDSFYETNDIDKTILKLEKYAEYDLNYSSTRAILAILKSTFTVDQKDLERATKYATQTVQLCDKIRRRGIVETVMRYLWTPDYNKYTEIEVYAELTFGAMMAYSGALGLANCRSILDFIRLVNRLRLAKNTFKDCRSILKHRTNWESDLARNQFEACVGVERGVRNLVFGSLPPRVLKLLNFFGYKGDRDLGFGELAKVSLDFDGVYSRGAETVFLIYHLYVRPMFACYLPTSVVCEKIFKRGLRRHPNFILYHILNAKYNYLINPKPLDRAIKRYEQTLTIDKTIQTFNAIPYFDLIWCYVFKRDWDQTIKYAHLLRKKALHTQVIFTYFEAIFRYVKSLETNDKTCREEANQLFKSIPHLPILYWGFKLAIETIAIENSRRYFENNEYLILPVMEMLYLWNQFVVIKGNIEILNRFLAIVEEEMEKHDKNSDKTKYLDTYLSALFYKGVILRYMGRYSESKVCFTEVLDEKDRLNSCQSIIGQTVMELGFTEFEMNNRRETKRLWNKVLNEYTGHPVDIILHTKVYSALRELGLNSDGIDLSTDDSTSFNSEDSLPYGSDDDFKDDFDARHELMRL